MSAVTGSIVASKSISISRAARKLAQFVESDTGARPDTAAYLRRSVAAFNELIDFHDELERGVENGGDEEIEERKEESTVGEVQDGDSASEMKKKKKKKRKREKVDDARSDIELSKDKIDGLYELEKEYNLDAGNGMAVSSEGDSGRKKKKRKKSEKEKYVEEN